MNLLLAMPVEARLVVLFLLGTAAAGMVNWAAYSLAWERRAISPWSTAPPGATPRSWLDCLPVLGWWRLRREASLHGRGFWIRPLVVEISAGLLIAGLYWWEVSRLGLMGQVMLARPPVGVFVTLAAEAAQAQFCSHALLCLLMLAASLIDADEKTIPDAITVPGSLVALLAAIYWPTSVGLPANAWVSAGLTQFEQLTLASPLPWPATFFNYPSIAGLATALGCWAFWCFGLMPRRWNTSRGWVMAWRVFWHRLRLEASTYLLLGLFVLGSCVIAATWYFGAAVSWAAMVSQLVGLAVGLAMIWTVRVVASGVLGREAMGFGDATLMGMIGAFLGWQSTLIVFFLAPFAGLTLGLTQWILRRTNLIAFGPFLCLAALATIVGWGPIWVYVAPLFGAGWLVPAVMVVCVVMLAVLLGVWRMLLLLFAPRG